MLMSSASSARSADCLLAFTFSPSGHIAFFGADVHQEGRKEERKRKEEDISTWLNFPLFAKVGGSGLPSPLPSFLFQPSSPGMFTVRSRKALCTPPLQLPLPHMFSHMDASSAATCVFHGTAVSFH